MFHAEAKDRCSVVIADLFLLGVKADALANDGGFGAGGAPDWEGHFETHGENALAGLPRAVAQSMPVEFRG